ncbi:MULTISPECIES: hypothetical protein [Pseudoalteromonas]|uniref:hypothetical protein n=1 Tax=Pseudoalteromonas TaxID=53246 RepID=UPI00103AF6B2|nr:MULTISPECIES: hypothetical protein [Pseudoalteromonas]MCK8131933.1 hypothetical protein [Pseudoalteromonas sp. 2CM28B]
MTPPEIHIQSYFSLETDLAAYFSDWSEFVEGKEYDVLLRSNSGEEVTTKYIVEIEDGHEDKFVRVKGNKNGSLFQRVLGATSYQLAQHSDNLMVHKWS